MSLTITERNGTLFLNGNINSGTCGFLKNHLESLIDLKNELTINIESVKEIDVNGVSILKKVYDNAIKHNKTLWITGYGCKVMYDEFKNNKPA